MTDRPVLEAVGEVETVAKAIYDSHHFVKPWEHPDTVRRWHTSMLIAARFAIAALRDRDCRALSPTPIVNAGEER